MYALKYFWCWMIAPCRLGIDEELVALLGKHSPVSSQPLILFSPVKTFMLQVATKFSNCLNIMISEGLLREVGGILSKCLRCVIRDRFEVWLWGFCVCIYILGGGGLLINSPLFFRSILHLFTWTKHSTLSFLKQFYLRGINVIYFFNLKFPSSSLVPPSPNFFLVLSYSPPFLHWTAKLFPGFSFLISLSCCCYGLSIDKFCHSISLLFFLANAIWSVDNIWGGYVLLPCQFLEVILHRMPFRVLWLRTSFTYNSFVQ